MNRYKLLIGALLCTSIGLPVQSTASNQAVEIEEKTQESSRVIAAIVNKAPIYTDQLESRVQAAIDKYKRFNKGEQPDELKSQLQTKVLDQFIAAELFYQASLDHKVVDIENKIALKIKKLQAENTHDKSIKIDKVGIERQIRMDEYLKAHDLYAPQLPEKELRAFYEKNKSNFASKQDKVRVKHIILTKKPDLDSDKAKETLIKIRQEILKGKTFEEAAKEYSEDAHASNGGDLGYIEPGYMPKEFDQVAFSTESGNISEIIETEQGYHIIKTLEKRPKGFIPTFENMKDFLAQGFAREVKQKKVTAHFNKLKAKAQIQVLLPNTPRTN